MAADPSGPADTSMMRIVHSALRRDIARAQAVLSEPPYPDGEQRAALSKHLGWMMGFLQHHHEAEDRFLYPMVRAAKPDAAALLDDMDGEHSAIEPAKAQSWMRPGGTRLTRVAAKRCSPPSADSATSCSRIYDEKRTRPCLSSQQL